MQPVTTYDSALRQDVATSRCARLTQAREATTPCNYDLIDTPTLVLPRFLSFWGEDPTNFYYSSSFHKLPTKAVAVNLAQEAFENFNQYFPIFEERNFLQIFLDCYLKSTPTDPSWWACVNVILSLAYRFRAMRRLDNKCDTTESYKFMLNALAVVPELSGSHHCLLAVQALVGLTVLLLGTPKQQISSVLISTAVRLAQKMGLHRKSNNLERTGREMEERRNLFWIAYILDKDISLQTERPFVQDDDDMEVDIPAGTDSKTLPRCQSLTFLNCRIGLAIIQGQIYRQLCSAQASRQSEDDRATAALHLSSALSYWKRSLPTDFENYISSQKDPERMVEVVHLSIIHFTYVNSMVLVEHYLYPKAGCSPDGSFRLREMYSEESYVEVSRQAIILSQRLPYGDYAYIW